MALSNLERVNKGLSLLLEGLHPFVVRELKAHLGAHWEDLAIDKFPSGHHAELKTYEEWDIQVLLMIMQNNWNEVFKNTLGYAERSYVSEIREIRNRAAHQTKQNVFASRDAIRALDTMQRLLESISASQADLIDKEREILVRIQMGEKERKTARRFEANLVDTQPTGGLKPWREVVTPHRDVASGEYQQAEFAADLQKVYREGEEAGEYGDPIEFFRRTYLTGGLKRLLATSIKRLTNEGGDPVVNLQTNFGGGKTHALLSVYHLFSGADFSGIRDLESLFQELGSGNPPKLPRAVIVGNRISPGLIHEKEDGTKLRTLWGEIAWQLGGKKGFEMVRPADETSTNPGDLLSDLFRQYAPCLILVDELVAYSRQLKDDDSLPAGTADTHYTFIQTLTETAKTVPGVFLVMSLPQSHIEIGGEKGSEALDKIKHIVGRVESPWSPATTEESFEIVSRRLFSHLDKPEQFQARDAVVRAFSDFYQQHPNEFPKRVTTAEYRERMKKSYPLHPELMDRLAEDWSGLDRFQRTRGILRLMAKVIHLLWENNDQSPIILPANIPLDSPEIQTELMQYLEDPWRAVIEKDVDGPNSIALELDNDNPTLGRYQAARRVSHTLFFGSAPTYRAANRGLEEPSIKLGSVLPGQSIPTFSDALRKSIDKATYLYVDNRRYWYSTQPNVTRTAEDMAEQFKPEDIWEEVKRRLESQLRNRGDFSRVHLMPDSSHDVMDEKETRLVILKVHHPHTPKLDNSPAKAAAQDILFNRGNAQRLYRNTLVFLAADQNRLAELDQSVRMYLAWNAIKAKREELNLDAFQTRQAEEKARTSNMAIDQRIPETFIWLLNPTQPSPQSPVIEWQEIRLQTIVGDSLAERASRKLISDGAMFATYAGVLLRVELDKIPLWQGDHVSLKQLSEYYAQYLYLPRLKNQDLLAAAVNEGISNASWKKDAFAYASGYSDSGSRYIGLMVGRQTMVSLENGLLVKPEAAEAQFIREREEEEARQRAAGGKGPDDYGKGGEEGKKKSGVEEGGEDEKPATPRRFYGTVHLDPVRPIRDVEQITDEVIQHFTQLPGAKVHVTLEIRVELPEDLPEHLQRTVQENARVLKFGESEFE